MSGSHLVFSLVRHAANMKSVTRAIIIALGVCLVLSVALSNISDLIGPPSDDALANAAPAGHYSRTQSGWTDPRGSPPNG
jgi:hypothetical protein